MTLKSGNEMSDFFAELMPSSVNLPLLTARLYLKGLSGTSPLLVQPALAQLLIYLIVLLLITRRSDMLG